MEYSPKQKPLDLKSAQEEANILRQINREFRMDGDFARLSKATDYNTALMILEGLKKGTANETIRGKIREWIDFLKLRVRANKYAEGEVEVEEVIKNLETHMSKGPFDI